MKVTILHGNIVSAPELGKLDIVEHGYLVAENGVIVGVFQNLPDKYIGHEIIGNGNNLILQSFSDMHIHAPQFPMLGMGMDMPLIEWLNTYTFPTESRFSDPEHARKVYHQLAYWLKANGTTRVCMFSSLHREGTMILMEELEEAGLSGYVGKVNMDRNGGENYQETTWESVKETLLWLEECEKFKNIKPIITPRFTPCCTNDLMDVLGKLAKEKNLPIQSHLSENTNEIAWVKELHPDCPQYWETYEKYGMWNDRTVMAHCVWSDERERKAIKDAGVYVAHCASSNENLISGYAPIRKMLNEGVKVTLGTDIAAGDSLSMFDAAAAAIKASKARRIMDNWETDFLTVADAYYLATSAAAEFFGEKPGFAPGNPFSAIVLRDNELLLPKEMSVLERFERSIYHRQHTAVKSVWANGKKIYSNE